MDISKIKKELFKDIKSSRIDKALDKLEKMTEENVSTNAQVVLILYNYNYNQKLYDSGRLTIDIYNSENQKIAKRLLEIIGDLEEKDIKKEFKKESSQVKLDYELTKKENESLKEQIRILTNLYQGGNESINSALKEMEGYWIEVIPSLAEEGRLFSIGRFYYDEILKEYKFDGVNYRNSGEPFYEWKTWKIITDLKSNPKVIHNIYSTQNPRKPYSTSNGYSKLFLDLHHHDNKWIIKSGYFDDLGDGKPPRHFDTFRLDDIVKRIGFDESFKKKNSFKRLIKNLDARKDDLFGDLFS